MVHPRTPGDIFASGLRKAALLLLFVLVTVWLQWLNQSYVAEFGSEGDEAAHYVTSLMVREYVAEGMPGNPVRYAERYYVHYPKVAFGAWPPLFHLVSGVWMLLFSADRASIMMLIGALSGGCAFLISRFLAREVGEAAGIIGGLIFLTLPAIQKLSAKVMLDMMVAMLSLAAVICYARYLERERSRDSALFGLFASLAILTKYNALALAFVPIISVVLTGNYSLLRRRSFWLPAVVVLAVAGPWYLSMNHLVWYAAQPVPGLADIPYSLWRHVVGMVTVMQGLLLLTAVAGVIEWRRNRYRDIAWAAPAAQIVGILLFHNFLYIGYDERYISQAIPALVLFALKGALYAARLVEARVKGEVVAGAMFAMLPLIGLHPSAGWEPPKQYHGYPQVVERLCSEQPSAQRVLISAETQGEGMLISELAMKEGKPARVVLRASKTFASASWMQQDYKLLFDPDTAMRHLQDIGVDVLVFDRGPGSPLPHHAMVKQMVERYSSGWSKLMTVGTVDVYRLPVVAAKARKIEVDLKHTLGKTVVD